MKRIFTHEETKEILQSFRDQVGAEIFDSVENPDNLVQVHELPLDTAATDANPYDIGSPFKSIYVARATDISVEVNLKPGTRGSSQSKIPLTLKDGWNIGRVIRGGFLTWESQPGKTMTLLVFINSEFRSGSQISQNSGGVSITEGSSTGATTQVTLAATTATIIAPQDLTRKVTTIQNATGADLYVSGANTVTNAGATRGILILNGESIKWRNTGALYGYSVAGGDVHYMTET